jgi:hypothetical protein
MKRASLPLHRRTFVTLLGGAASWPLAARTQETQRVRRVGFLRAAPPSERELEALLRGLVDHGWVQGRNWARGALGKQPAAHPFPVLGRSPRA